jgi:Transposase and inactivated derivatives
MKVAPSTVTGWAEASGTRAGRFRPSKSRGRWGRRRGLDEAQRQQLAKALRAGALAAGFATELWTLPRVGRLIQRQFGRRYSDSQVWRILRDMGFSPQRPSRRARERDAAAIAEWKKRRWPALKKTL